jgi:hypothetical protein
MLIANETLSCCLSFSLTSEQNFGPVITSALTIGSSYQAWSHNQISNELLDLWSLYKKK